MTKKIQKFLNYIKSIFKIGIYTKEEYWDNGNLESRVNYKNGKWHGLCEWWGEGGIIRFRGNYEDGKPYGLSGWWNYNGTLEYKKYYFNGKEITEFEYDVLEASEEI